MLLKVSVVKNVLKILNAKQPPTTNGVAHAPYAPLTMDSSTHPLDTSSMIVPTYQQML